MILQRQDLVLYYGGALCLVPEFGVFRIHDLNADRHGMTALIGEYRDPGMDGLFGRWRARGSSQVNVQQERDDKEFAPALIKKLTHVGYRPFDEFVIRATSIPVRGAKKALHSTNTTVSLVPRSHAGMAKVAKWGDYCVAQPTVDYPNIALALLTAPKYLPYPDVVERVFEFKTLAGTWHPSFCISPEEGMKFPALYMEDRIIGYVRPDASVVLGKQFTPFIEPLQESGVREITYE